LLSIYIDSKDLQSNFEVPAVCGSTYFWVSLYKLPTVLHLQNISFDDLALPMQYLKLRGFQGTQFFSGPKNQKSQGLNVPRVLRREDKRPTVAMYGHGFPSITNW
jgi:hypothetical protein